MKEEGYLLMMSQCVIAFFDDVYQRKLKEYTFGNSSFEQTLKDYRDLFLDEFKKLCCLNYEVGCSTCSQCLVSRPINNDFIKFINDFTCDISGKIELIELFFNEIIDIYITAISENRAFAIRKMHSFVSNRCHGFNVQGAMSFSRPLFRARKKGKYDGNDIHELFHVPFDKRFLISNQRFSLTGIPLLYLAESLPLALREIESDIRHSNVAVFLPKYSNFYKEGMYDITNPIIRNLFTVEKEVLFGCKLVYDNDFGISFNKNDIDYYLARFVLSQCLHYPVQEKYRGYFIQEYVLPQLMMDVVSIRKWKGIGYQSCKPINNECRDDFNRYVDENYCFNVEYCSSTYNEKMLDDFYYATWCNEEKTITYSELKKKIQELIELNNIAQEKGFNMNDYISYIVGIKIHIKRMIKTIGKKAYLRRKNCRVEITLLYRVLEEITPIVKNPEKYGVVKISK